MKTPPNEDPSTPAQKLAVCGIAFFVSTAALVVTAALVLPLLTAAMSALAAPGWLQGLAVFGVLLGAPVAGGIAGVQIGVRACGLSPVPARRD